MVALPVVSFILDSLLVIAAVVGYLARPRIGGELAVGMRILLVCVVILGAAALSSSFLAFSKCAERLKGKLHIERNITELTA